MKFLTSLIAGVMFGGGLLLSGMTDPANVLGFLDIFGEWRPQLALVMGGAMVTAAPAFFYVRRRNRTVLGEQATLPDRSRIDAPLLAGAAIFGIGWGIGGICPGPGIVLLTSGTLSAWLFIVAVCVGSVTVSFWRARQTPE